MKKTEFLEALKKKLKEKGIHPEDSKEVLDDYRAMIEEALLSQEDEGKFIEGLGTPSSILRSLKLRKTPLQKNKEKIIGISPFIAIIIFFLAGFFLNGFAYSWLAFLLIPMTAIVLEESGFDRLIGLSVFGAIFAFFGLGFGFDLWHPGWVVFTLLVPAGLAGQTVKFKWLLMTIALGLIGSYTILEFMVPARLNTLILIPLIPLAFSSKVIQIKLEDIKFKWKVSFLGLGFALLISSTYIYLGWTFGWWHPAWIILLLIPIGLVGYSQWADKERFSLIEYMPFVSVILFVIIGEMFNGYAYSWLIFLLIPMVGVLSDKGDE